MTYALLAQVNEAEEAVSRGNFSAAVMIHLSLSENLTPGAVIAAQIVDDILRDGMRERACKYEARQ